MKALSLCSSEEQAPEVNNKLWRPILNIASALLPRLVRLTATKPDRTCQFWVYSVTITVVSSCNMAATCVNYDLRCRKVSNSLRVCQLVIVSRLQIRPVVLQTCISHSMEKIKKERKRERERLNAAGNYCDYFGV